MAAVNETRYFCLPPLGQPDPTQPRPPLNEPDNRDRVACAARQGLQYGVDTFEVIRPRFEAPNGDQFKERAVEKAWAAFLSEMDKVNSTHLYFYNMDSESVESMKGWTKTFIDEQPGCSLALRNSTLENLDIGPEIPGFLEQDSYGNMYDYLVKKYESKKIACCERFLTKLGTTFDSVIQENFSKVETGKFGFASSWNMANELARQYPDEFGKILFIYADILARSAFIQRMHIKESDWTPGQTIDQLIDELRKNGPHVVIGTFGATYYSELPHECLDEHMQYPIFGWNPAARIGDEDIETSHAVILVGADQAKKRVYFIDPHDESNPKNQIARKVYTMSYARLCKSACNQLGSSFDDAKRMPRGLVYAYRGPTLEELGRPRSIDDQKS